MSRLPRPVSIRNQPYALPLALLCAQSVLLAVAPPAAQAQPYPSRALRIVVPFPPDRKSTRLNSSH